MSATKNNWGIRIFIFALSTIAAALYIVFTYPPAEFNTLYLKVFPSLGLLFSIASFLAGHYSYPRVHNLKVYLLGYLTGLTGISYFLLFNGATRLNDGIITIYLLIFINMLTILFIPSYTKYRLTKIITFSILGVELFWLLATKFFPQVADWTNIVVRGEFTGKAIPTAILFILWLGTIVGFSIHFMKKEFFLGGIISGTALFYTLAWFSPAITDIEYYAQTESVLFVFQMLFLDVAMIIHWFSRMEHRISYDPLLQIYNRNYCSKIIDEQSSVKTIPPLGIAMVDIDHFKSVNDTHGHQAGDKVLHSVAQVIQNEVIPEGIACRYGGEEIIIFFPGKTSKEMKDTLENVREAIEGTKVQTKKKKLNVTVSIGYSCRDDLSQTIMDVINTADKALYKAKSGGRNQLKVAKTPNKSKTKK